MKIFVTGATGYIGGSVAVALAAAGHHVSGLARSQEKAGRLKTLGIRPVIGDLDDDCVLTGAAQAADAVIHAAHADHAGSARALLAGLDGTGKRMIHTSGSSIVGTAAGGELLEPAYTEEMPYDPSPGRAARVALNAEILAAADRGVDVAIIAPSLIYGLGRGPGRHSMQIPWLIRTAQALGHPGHLGPGTNRWSNVHLDDLVDLYLLALTGAPPGAFYWAENGENSMAELAAAIGRMLGQGPPQALTLDQAAIQWGEGPAANTMGSNSRVRAARARAELGWTPHRSSAIAEIEQGCYAQEFAPAT